MKWQDLGGAKTPTSQSLRRGESQGMTRLRAGPRQSEAAAGLGAPKTSFFPTFLRAGFEPLPGHSHPKRLIAAKIVLP
jgi:hypothetical protein